MAPPTKPIAVIPAATAAVTPAGESSTTMQSCGCDARSCARHAGTDRARACRRHIVGRKQIALEEASQLGGFEAHAHALERRRRRDAFRTAQPGQRVHRHAAWRALLRCSVQAWPRETASGNFGGSCTPVAVLDIGEHVGRTPSGEIARDHLRRHLDADALERLRRDRGRDRLGIHQHAIAVEDDHARDGPAGSADWPAASTDSVRRNDMGAAPAA